ncbi:MAG: adenylyl-sulfate kinase [Deltaproteobacteria bacterium]|nr:MAG: adenylyl-sulfate kinase [Deltaproteobacteria bacterium]
MPDDSPALAPNIAWQVDGVGRARREAIAGHRGAVVWLTGLSGSGKTTIARAVDQILVERGIRSYVLDSENIRHGLSRGLGFSLDDRVEHIRRVTEVAKLFADSATILFVAAISPYRWMRRRARDIIGGDFLEIHVATPLEVCEARDPRGLYRRARAGEIADFTGVSAPYEEPVDAELVLHPESESLEQSVGKVLDFLDSFNILRLPMP